MKRKSIILWGLVVLFIFSISLAILAKEQVYDFRKTNWGMSKEQVKATEDKKADYEDNVQLSYDEVTISGKSGKDFGCSYYFLEDKLYCSIYGFSGKHINKNLYIEDYEELKETLTKKYGKPKIDKVIWKKDLFKDDKSYWGTAVIGGDLSCLAQWETPDTEIELKLFGENWRIKLTLSYESRGLKEWAREKREIIHEEIEKSKKEKEDKQEGLIVLEGTGQEATEKFVLREGLVKFDMFHKGKHNFAIWLLDNDGRKVELLVNTIGYFDGSKAIRIDKTGTYLLDISADGYWAVMIWND